MKRSPQNAFTLVEMIVVIAILAVLAGLVVGRGPVRSARLDLDGAGRTVAHSLQLTRSRAIAQDRTIRWLAGPFGFGAEGETPQHLPANVGLQAPAAIGFAADGSASGGRVILHDGDRRLAIGVDWLTGRIRLADGV